ncbi:sodium-dependent transporter [Azospirillum thermophilum]|uniref:Transporter n=1 Tax=Azospirillum thermophilum TaxID=2202148 RepID=A0A2S2CK46_9PROT|nr:sodium-dependent transporter [Azospirillum thermophilum]AWK84885.1 sodium-dependent transporter [Azospirillum thermophilum]
MTDIDSTADGLRAAAPSGSASDAAPVRHAQWSSRLAFILAATGSAVGLGNIWKFPYITGEYGGGAFVLVYLACIAVIGIPIMMAEVALGRRGGQSPINTMRRILREDGRSRHWALIGWLGVAAAFLILTFYSVIGGWAVAYVVRAGGGAFSGASSDGIAALFSGLLASPGELLFWHGVFMALTVAVVARGVSGGLERATSILMPALFVILLVLVGYALASGHFSQGLRFLFSPDFSKIGVGGVLAALGHAFFTLSLGMGVMIAYGSYLPRGVSITRTAVSVSVMDTTVALLAGLAIFPLVYANGLEPSAGPGLVFKTLPLAFGQMPLGGLFGAAFFVLLVFAAWTSSISLLEPLVEWLEEHRGVRRGIAAAAAGIVAWVIGIASALSFNLWADVRPLGMFAAFADKGIFDLLDYLTANLMLPLVGLATAVFAGWVLSPRILEGELSEGRGHVFRLWRFLIRWVSPVAVAAVFWHNLG